MRTPKKTTDLEVFQSLMRVLPEKRVTKQNDGKEVDLSVNRVIRSMANELRVKIIEILEGQPILEVTNVLCANENHTLTQSNINTVKKVKDLLSMVDILKKHLDLSEEEHDQIEEALAEFAKRAVKHMDTLFTFDLTPNQIPKTLRITPEVEAPEQIAKILLKTRKKTFTGRLRLLFTGILRTLHPKAFNPETMEERVRGLIAGENRMKTGGLIALPLLMGLQEIDPGFSITTSIPVAMFIVAIVGEGAITARHKELLTHTRRLEKQMAKGELPKDIRDFFSHSQEARELIQEFNNQVLPKLQEDLTAENLKSVLKRRIELEEMRREVVERSEEVCEGLLKSKDPTQLTSILEKQGDYIEALKEIQETEAKVPKTNNTAQKSTEETKPNPIGRAVIRRKAPTK